MATDEEVERVADAIEAVVPFGVDRVVIARVAITALRAMDREKAASKRKAEADDLWRTGT